LNLRILVIAIAVLGAGSSVFAQSPKALPTLAANAFPIPVPVYLSKAIADASAKYRVDPNLIAAMAFRESAFNSSAVSTRGAQGIMQLMPKTAHALGVDNAFDVRQNVFGGTKYVASLLQRFGGNVELALAAYNAGPELVSKVGPSATPEAIAYVAAVKGYYTGALRVIND
jgi:soluble lytic murein transglycosylase-like protein